MDMIEKYLSGWRLKVAAALSLLTVVVGARTLWAYGSTGAYLALFTVALLLAVDAVGLWSFLTTKLSLRLELDELHKPGEPTSPFWVRRRERLQAVKALGATPDVEALISVDEAELAGHTSFARYLVTASVLIGLVGTFAGLSETIGSFAPIFSDASNEFGDKLLAPLAGLAVTFGASVVAILATLALSLAAGDVTLAERQVLARLDERTRHELVPTIFPPSESLQAQTLRALSLLSSEWRQASEHHLQQLQGLLARTSERWTEEQTVLATRYTDATATVVDRAAQMVEDTAARVLAELGRSVGESSRALTQATTDITAQLSAASAQMVRAATSASTELSLVAATASSELSRATSTASTELSRAASTASTELSRAASTASTELSLAAATASTELSRATATASTELSMATAEAAETVEQKVDRLDRSLAASHSAWVASLQDQLRSAVEAQRKLSEQQEKTLGALAERYEQNAASLTEAHAVATRTASGEFSRLVGQLSESVGEVAREGLVRSSVELGEAARRLERGAEVFSGVSAQLQPSLDRLTPELSAMARETALLVANRDTETSDDALVSELQRLSESMAEVKALLAFGQRDDDASEAAQ